MIKTPLCSLLHIEYPILQGGMAWVATGELALAVSKAGGLGIIGAGSAPPDVIRKEIAKVKEATERPFGVNVMLMSPFVDDVMEVILEERVDVVTTGAGNPASYIPHLIDAKIKVLPLISSVAMAKRLARLPITGVIAEGTEAGGHIGDLTTMTLLPQICDAVDLPVIAAGGIADGRGFAAALLLGAVGVQMGTRFVCASESIAHENYKEAIVKAHDRDAVVTGRSTGHPVRNLRNRLTYQMNRMEREGASVEELEKKGEGRLRDAVLLGEIHEGSVMAGQIAGLIKDILPAEEILISTMRDTERELKRVLSLTGLLTNDRG